MSHSLSHTTCMSEQRNESKAAAARQLAPICNLEAVRSGDHFVQFYEDEQFLMQALGAYVGQGLVQGESSVLILTNEHRSALEAKLARGGIDALEYQRRGMYYAYDARETLACFMQDGHPNERRFRATIEPILQVAGQGSSGVRAFGEMVTMLWADGQKAATIELEMLWNDLLERNAFGLLCAYPISGFSNEEKQRELRHICRAHTCVIPHEGYCDPFLPSGARQN